MKEELISFETAKLAKEKGYTQEWLDHYEYYKEDGSLHNWKYDYPAPTQSLLQKWLREVHEIHIHIEVWRNMDHCDEYKGFITKPAYIKPLYDKTNKGLDIMEIKRVSFKYEYKEALEAVLQEALKLIKKFHKDY